MKPQTGWRQTQVRFPPFLLSASPSPLAPPSIAHLNPFAFWRFFPLFFPLDYFQETKNQQKIIAETTQVGERRGELERGLFSGDEGKALYVFRPPLRGS